MKKIITYLGVIAISLAVTTGCKSLWRANDTTASLAVATMSGWADYYVNQTNGASPERLAELNKQKAIVDDASIKVGESLAVAELLTWSAMTNKTAKTHLDQALSSVSVNMSNITWLITKFQSSSTKGVK